MIGMRESLDRQRHPGSPPAGRATNKNGGPTRLKLMEIRTISVIRTVGDFVKSRDMKALNHTAYLEDVIRQLKRNPTDDCVLWPFYTDPEKGYGYVKYNGENSTTHRAAFQLYYDQEPENMVLHKCSNASCFNPLHLYDGTAKQNMQDMVDDWGYHPGGRRKLTEENVIQIIELLKQHIGQDIIAARFGVNRSTISAINIGKTWQHIPRSGKPSARTRRSPKTGIVMQYHECDVKPAKKPLLTTQQLRVASSLLIRGFSLRETANWFNLKPRQLKKLLGLL